MRMIPSLFKLDSSEILFLPMVTDPTSRPHLNRVPEENSMKVFGAYFGTETNTFSPIPTSEVNFEEYGIMRANDALVEDRAFEAGMVRWQEITAERGGIFRFGLRAFCQPSAPINRATYESLRDELLDQIKLSGPHDIVLLGLHGAMMAHGYDDCEGDILARVRTLVGSDVVVGAVLDPHAHLTNEMTVNTDVLVFFKEYPHTDYAERYEDLMEICWRTATKEVTPHMATFDCRLIQLWPTQNDPIRTFVDDMSSAECEEGILSVSFIHGFPWSDSPDLGSKILVVTDNQPEYGKELAVTLGQRVWAMRNHTCWKHITVEEAINRTAGSLEGPIVMAETSDNPGAGAPQDSTLVLSKLLELGVDDAVIACIWDPVAVQICFQAGEGTMIDLRIGGKIGPASGDPVDMTVRVEALRKNATIRPFGGESQWPLGDVARVSQGGIDVILCSIRNQTFSTDPIISVGIDPTARKILVIKSSNHFYAGFAPIAKEILYVATPGAVSADFRTIDYTKLKRPIWPLVEDPFENS